MVQRFKRGRTTRWRPALQYYCIVYSTKVNESYVISNLNFYLENVVKFGIRSDYDSGSESHRKVGYGISVAEPVHF